MMTGKTCAAMLVVVTALTGASCSMFGTRVGPCSDPDQYKPAAEHSQTAGRVKEAVANLEKAKSIAHAGGDARDGLTAAESCERGIRSIASIRFEACGERWSYDLEKETVDTPEGKLTLRTLKNRCEEVGKTFSEKLATMNESQREKDKAAFEATVAKAKGDRVGILRELGYPEQMKKDSDEWLQAPVWSYNFEQGDTTRGFTRCKVAFAFEADRMTRQSAEPKDCYGSRK